LPAKRRIESVSAARLEAHEKRRTNPAPRPTIGDASNAPPHGVREREAASPRSSSGKDGRYGTEAGALDQGATSSHELLLHGHDVTIYHIPEGESFMFVVRDPLSRFVSGFNGRLREDRPRYHYPWKAEEKIAFSIFTTPDQLATALSADDEVERRQAEDAMRGIGHINTSYWFWFVDEKSFRNRLSDVFFIAFQDQLDEDFDLLKRKLGLPAEARLPADELVAHRTPDGFALELGEVARSNLERWYEHDLAFTRICRELAPTVNGAAKRS
jgi:hypothetical protein